MNMAPNEIAGSVNIGVIGAGSWGTALSDLLGEKGYRVHLWAFEPEVAENIEKNNENHLYMPGMRLSDNIKASSNLAEVVRGKDFLLIVVPSHFMRHTVSQISAIIRKEEHPEIWGKNTVVVTASKGIELNSWMSMHEVIMEALPEINRERVAVISGPSFAKEVVKKLPTAVVAASDNDHVARIVQHVFATPYFRVYTNKDMKGVEIGGAVKNVIAIAAGIVDGMELGLNTRAALITRGLAEIRRLGIRLGADPMTFSGLSGMGDLVLTCTGDLSRNHTVGKKIGQGMKLKDILKDMRMVAEGVKNAESVYILASELNVDMPITHAVYHILYKELSPKEAVYRLMTRDLKQEIDSE